VEETIEEARPLGQLRLELKGLLVVAHGFLETSLTVVQDAAVGPGLGELRVFLDQLVEDAPRLLVVFGLDVDQGFAQTGRQIGRVYLLDLSETLKGPFVFSPGQAIVSFAIGHLPGEFLAVGGDVRKPPGEKPYDEETNHQVAQVLGSHISLD